jgi:hypothetical protein
VTDTAYETKYKVAAAVFSVFFILFFAGILVFGYKIFKGRKDYQAIMSQGNELKKHIKEKQKKLKELQAANGASEDQWKEERTKINQEQR